MWDLALRGLGLAAWSDPTAFTGLIDGSYDGAILLGGTGDPLAELVARDSGATSPAVLNHFREDGLRHPPLQVGVGDAASATWPYQLAVFLEVAQISGRYVGAVDEP